MSLPDGDRSLPRIDHRPARSPQPPSPPRESPRSRTGAVRNRTRHGPGATSPKSSRRARAFQIPARENSASGQAPARANCASLGGDRKGARTVEPSSAESVCPPQAVFTRGCTRSPARIRWKSLSRPIPPPRRVRADRLSHECRIRTRNPRHGPRVSRTRASATFAGPAPAAPPEAPSRGGREKPPMGLSWAPEPKGAGRRSVPGGTSDRNPGPGRSRRGSSEPVKGLLPIVTPCASPCHFACSVRFRVLPYVTLTFRRGITPGCGPAGTQGAS